MSNFSYDTVTQQAESYITRQLAVADQLSETDGASFVSEAFGAYSLWFALTCAEQGERHLENVRRLRALVPQRR